MMLLLLPLLMLLLFDNAMHMYKGYEYGTVLYAFSVAAAALYTIRIWDCPICVYACYYRTGPVTQKVDPPYLVPPGPNIWTPG